MEKNTLTIHLTPEEEVAKCAHLLARNDRVYHALSRLRVLHVSLDTLRRHNVKRLAMRYSSNKELAGAVRVVVEMMEKLEEEERLEGKPPLAVKSVKHFRPRKAPSQPVATTTATIQTRSSSTLEKAKLPFTKPPVLVTQNAPPNQTRIKKPPPQEDVSKLCNLPESEYDRVRPILIGLPVKALKSFMDRNPEIEAVSDGLFRRHCQLDFPEEVTRKSPSEKWRTLHDVNSNWKLYNETKRWEESIRKNLKRKEPSDLYNYCNWQMSMMRKDV